MGLSLADRAPISAMSMQHAIREYCTFAGYADKISPHKTASCGKKSQPIETYPCE